MKSASDPAVKEKADALLGKETAGEKAPHPQVGNPESQKDPKRDLDDDPGAKAPHGDSSDDDGEVLEAKLRSVSLAPPRQPSEVRADKAAYDEDERRLSVPSSKPARKEKKKQAGKASEVHSAKGEELVKRKKKSKHGSKKAAKKASKSRPSHDPEADDWELDIGDDMPREVLKKSLTAMHRVNKGLKASSEQADSAVSEMSQLMGKWSRARDAERGWLQEENRILKDLVGWKRSATRAPSPPPTDSEEETDNLEEDEAEEEDAPDM